MRDKDFLYQIISVVTAVLLIASVFIFAVWIRDIERERIREEKAATKTSVYAKIVDKDTYMITNGKVAIRKYKAIVDIDGTNQDVNIPSDVYNVIEIGDDIEVTVYTSEKGIVTVKYGDMEKQ